MGFNVGHIFKTTNAGTTWIDFSGSLPQTAPVNSIVVDSEASTIYAGTDVGVFSSSTASPNWTEVGPASGSAGVLPNVPVTALRLFNANGLKLLRAATYGRGVWQYALTTAPDYSIAISNSPMTLFGAATGNFIGTLTSFNGYSGQVAMTCSAGSSAPPSICTFATSPLTPTTNGAPLSVSVGGSIGDYSFNIHGVGNDASHISHDAAVILHVVDFEIGSPSPGSFSVSQGSSANVTFTVSALGSFHGTVNLVCSGLPAGGSCGFSPSSAQPLLGSPVTVTLTLSAASTSPTGTNQVVISASTPEAPAAKTQTLGVTVVSAPFSLTSVVGAQTVHAGASANYSLSLTPLQGSTLASSVQFSCSQVDLAAAIAQCLFTPSQIPAGATGNQTIALTITTADPAPQGQFQPRTDFPPKTHGARAAALLLVMPIAGFLIGACATRSRKRSRRNAAWWTLVIVAIELILLSCGSGSGSSATGSLVSVTVSPATANVYPTQTQQFIAQVTGTTNTAVNWTATQGAIDVNGLYTPPGTVAASTTATVTATAQANSSVTGEAAVTILAISVQVTPASTTLFPSQMQQFNATVSGSKNTAVIWTLSSGAGTVSASGLYTAPPSVTSSQQAIVKATSQADQTKSETANIALAPQTPSGAYSIHVNATSGTLVETTTVTLTVQ